MSADGRKERIVRAFSTHAGAYDAAADVQWQVAHRLADRIESLSTKPQRILEIGCGTGFLSSRLKDMFPVADLTLTDIAGSMLERCRVRVGDGPHYVVMDGERPDAVEGTFDLITASLAFQWFVDLSASLLRLSALLAPGGRMIFATLGVHTFEEWRAAHKSLGFTCGTPLYPDPEKFPWPEGFDTLVENEMLSCPYLDGHDFVRSLKALGASEPAPGHRPLSPGAFRRLLTSLENGFSVTYHVIYGQVIKP